MTTVLPCGCTGSVAQTCARWRAEQLAAAPSLTDRQKSEIRNAYLGSLTAERRAS